jgi:putative phosphoribosyl transferase
MSAGRTLAALLAEYAHRDDTIVLALPRGGVPVAKEIALTLQAPLDVLVVRKLGLPWQPEFAAGAIAPGGVLVLNREARAEVPGLSRLLEPVVTQERQELARREATYRRGRPPLDVAGRTVILVDDGIATGATIEAAAVALRAMNARSIVIAVPVAPPGATRRLARHADRIVCPEQPADFMAVGQYYDEFPQLTDAEVVRLLAPGRPAVD